MKKQFILLLIIVLALVGFFLYKQVVKPQLDNRTVATVVSATITNETLGFGFTFPSGEAGFSMIEPPLPEGSVDGLQKIYLIMDTQSYLMYQQGDDAETPPAVSVFVFTMPDMESADGLDRLGKLKLWAETYSRYSSYALKTSDIETVEMDGIKAIRYTAEGALYKQQVYLVSYQGNIYMFAGQYINDADTIRDMYLQLVASATFD